MTTDPWIAELEASLARDHAWLRRLARGLVSDEGRADDLVQEAWARALVVRPQGLHAVRGWLATVVRNLARDQHSSAQHRTDREQRCARPEHEASTAQVVASAEIQRRLLESVMNLDEPLREALLLRYHGGLAPREIARRQGVPLTTVKSRLARGLAELRRRLDSSSARREWLGELALFARPAAPSAGAPPLAVTLGALLALGLVAAWGIDELRDKRSAASTEAPGPPLVEAQREPLQPSEHEPSTLSVAQAATGDHDIVHTSEQSVAPPPAISRRISREPQAPPGLVLVPGGSTHIGTPRSELIAMLEDNPQLLKNTGGFMAEVPRHSVQVESFFLMVTEVTHEQYREYVQACGARPPLSWGRQQIVAARQAHLVSEGERRQRAKREERPTPERVPFDDSEWWEQNWRSVEWSLPGELGLRPVTHVDYQDALGYACWAGLRLLDEQEFERAVRGDTDRLFPWGDKFEPAKFAATVELRGASEIYEVGSFPDGASEQGIVDLSGNVWEWTRSEYLAYPGFQHKKFILGKGNRKKVYDTPPPFSPDRRVIRGGSIQNSQFCARCTTRGGFDRFQRASALGFRCASSLQPGYDLALDCIAQLTATSPLDPRPDEVDYAPHEVVAMQRWRTAESECTVPDYEVIAAHDYVLFTPVARLSHDVQLDLAAGEEPIQLGLLSLSLATLDPPLPAGTYLVALRAEDRGALAPPARLLITDLEGRLAASLPIPRPTFDTRARPGIGLAAGSTVVIELCVKSSSAAFLTTSLALTFAAQDLEGSWR